MSGFIFYRGASSIDGAPIVGIATIGSHNVKTGPMIQTWIMRADIDPMRAVRSGADASICGACPHRGRADQDHLGLIGRTCYVEVARAPSSIWHAYQRGSYDDLSSGSAADAAAILARISGHTVRLGAYGDPAAIPAPVWVALLRGSVGRTGYTHQWRNPIAAGLRDLVMASADSASDRADAVAAGWRTFRVRTDTDPILPGEFACPASPEGGNRRTCKTCLACDGADRPGKSSPTIIVHGAMARHFRTAA